MDIAIYTNQLDIKLEGGVDFFNLLDEVGIGIRKNEPPEKVKDCFIYIINLYKSDDVKVDLFTPGVFAGLSKCFKMLTFCFVRKNESDIIKELNNNNIITVIPEDIVHIDKLNRIAEEFFDSFKKEGLDESEARIALLALLRKTWKKELNKKNTINELKQEYTK